MSDPLDRLDTFMIGLLFFCGGLAIGIAILRYRLYDIDRIISRTISWSLLTGLLSACFAGLVIGLQGSGDGGKYLASIMQLQTMLAKRMPTGR